MKQRIAIAGFYPDKNGDFISEKAFGDLEFLEVPVLRNHNQEEAIGTAKNIRIENGKIYADIEPIEPITGGAKLAGIGFICKAANYREQDGKEVREITEAELIEVSIMEDKHPEASDEELEKNHCIFRFSPK